MIPGVHQHFPCQYPDRNVAYLTGERKGAGRESTSERCCSLSFVKWSRSCVFLKGEVGVKWFNSLYDTLVTTHETLLVPHFFRLQPGCRTIALNIWDFSRSSASLHPVAMKHSCPALWEPAGPVPAQNQRGSSFIPSIPVCKKVNKTTSVELWEMFDGF